MNGEGPALLVFRPLEIVESLRDASAHYRVLNLGARQELLSRHPATTGLHKFRDVHPRVSEETPKDLVRAGGGAAWICLPIGIYPGHSLCPHNPPEKIVTKYVSHSAPLLAQPCQNLRSLRLSYGSCDNLVAYPLAHFVREFPSAFHCPELRKCRPTLALGWCRLLGRGEG